MIFLRTPSWPIPGNPRYYTDFHCIGDQCEDNCCHGWTISIDKEDVSSLCQSPGSLIQSTARQHIEKVKTQTLTGDYPYGRVWRLPFFWTVSDYANVHKKMGAEALSHTL